MMKRMEKINTKYLPFIILALTLALIVGFSTQLAKATTESKVLLNGVAMPEQDHLERKIYYLKGAKHLKLQYNYFDH